MRIQFYNCPDITIQKSTIDLPDLVPGLPLRPTITPKQLVLIGQGGSVTGAKAIIGALYPHIMGQLFVIDTVDPQYLNFVKSQLGSEAHVVAISKSGTTATTLEALSYFAKLPLTVIASKDSVLWQMGEKLEAQLIPHPDLGGRFSALSSVGLFPSAVLSADVDQVIVGGGEILKTHGVESLALRTAHTLFALEQQGYNEIYMPAYSKALAAFGPLITQLIHETYGKGGVGQTVLFAEGPESQHHTNQRYFGGPANMVLCLLSQSGFEKDGNISWPASTHSIPLWGQTVARFNGRAFSKSLSAESLGVLQAAKEQSRPIIHIEFPVISPVEVGKFIGFWFLVAIYGAQLRQLNPFDQPEVEKSKKLSIEQRRV